MNPWKSTVFQLLRDSVRFVLWLCVAINGLMFGVFTICFLYQWLWCLWEWCVREIFQPW